MRHSKLHRRSKIAATPDGVTSRFALSYVVKMWPSEKRYKKEENADET
jgi:hypothetical protein